jgi:radical SAM superfamily enzyme with C-terminal helix-hairpin-helix motif
MGDDAPMATIGKPEEVARARRFVLEADENGYVIRRVDDRAEVMRFPGTDDGLESALDEFGRRVKRDRRDRSWPRILVATVFISAVVWTIATVLSDVEIARESTSATFGNSGGSAALTIEYAVASAAYTVLFSSVAVFVVLSLRRRWPTND